MPGKTENFLLAFSAAALLAAAGPGLCAAGRRPSVVLVVIDSLRADRISPYGYKKSSTPALGKFAGRAAIFENARANSNWTAPSFASILTGRRPFSHGLLGHGDSLPDGIPTLQSVLAAAGYETAAFLTGLPGRPEFGLTRGFGHVEAESGASMKSHADAAAAWASALPADRDFFILLHGNDTHHPYRCYSGPGAPKADYPEFNREFIRYYNGIPGWDLARLAPAVWERALSLKGDGRFLSSVSDSYDACVSLEDSALAGLLAGLGEAGGRPLLVIVTSDHGDLLGEHGLLGHEQEFFEPLARVPLMISYPGGEGGQRVSAPAEHVDILPAVCRAAALACPAGIDGREPGESAGAGEGWAAAGGGGINHRKIVRNAAYSDGKIKISMRNGRWRLYDLAADPGETADAVYEKPAEFLKAASAYLSFSGAGSPGAIPPPPAENAGGCFEPFPSLPDLPASAGGCALAGLEAMRLVFSGRYEDAFAGLAISSCPAHDIQRQRAALALLRGAIGEAFPGGCGDCRFTALPGSWKVEKGSFTVVYRGDSGLECRNSEGGQVSEPGCAAPAAEMLNCIEKYRFRENGGRGPRGESLENALRKAGYLP